MSAPERDHHDDWQRVDAWRGAAIGAAIVAAVFSAVVGARMLSAHERMRSADPWKSPELLRMRAEIDNSIDSADNLPSR